MDPASSSYFGSTALRGDAILSLGDCLPEPDWPAPDASFANRVAALTNEHRVAMGLKPLGSYAKLANPAVWKARHMARYGYMTHDDPAPPVARSAGQRIAACGYIGSWGENIAYGYATPEAVVGAWLRSPGHRGNIENSRFSALGVGAAKGSAYFWAQCFGVGSDPLQPPLAVEIVAPLDGTTIGKRFTLDVLADGAVGETTWTLYADGLAVAMSTGGVRWHRSVWLKAGIRRRLRVVLRDGLGRTASDEAYVTIR